jgi:hypothetical protein
MMAANDIGVRLRDLNDSLNALEHDLSRRKTPPEGLGEFKDAVDEIRTNLIAVITATHSGNYDESIGQFRMHRGNQVCQNLLADVIDGTVTGDTDGFEECYQAVKNLYEQLTPTVTD